LGYSKKTVREAKNLRIIDDVLFRLMIEQDGVCQEILRTLLDDEELIVKSVKAQEQEVSLRREVVFDAKCILGDGTYCDIEMQKTDSENDIKRVRFHASIMTTNNTPKGTDFDDIPNVKVLYVTEYDALGTGQAVTHISRCQLKGKRYLPVDDGEDIIFAYTGSKQRNKQAYLLRLFLRKESFMDEQYPKLSAAMKHFKDTEGGQGKVCKSIELYAKEYAEEYAKECAYEKSLTHVNALMDKLDLSLEKVMNLLDLSEDEQSYILNNIQK
jgi:predicted transposase/invertase (TIGR01784 family)